MAIKISGLPSGVITVDGAASEATLQQLVGAINKLTGQPGSAPKGQDPTDKLNSNAQTLQERLKKTSDVVGATVSNTAELFNKAFTNTTPTIKDFSGILARYTPTAAGAKVVETFGGVVADNVEIFRTLSTAGIDLGDSILQAQLSAGAARLPLDVFARAVSSNSDTLSRAFGGATAGATKFAEMSGKVMATAGKDLSKLGFSMDEITTYSVSYIEQMQRSGRAQTMTTTQLAEGSIRYNLELDKMAKATGISRQQLDEANKAAARDTRMRLALSNLGDVERAAVTAKIEELKKVDPTGKLAAGFSDLIAGGGVALTKEARMFTLAMSQAGVDAGKMTRDIANGQKGAVEQVNAGFKQVAVSAKNMSDAEKKTTTAMATLGQDTPMYYKAAMGQIGDGNKAMAAATEEQAKKLASQDPTRAVAGLDQTLTEVQNSFKKSLIDSKVLEATANGMTLAATKAKEAADEFAGMNTTQKLGAVLGLEFARVVGPLIAGYLAGKGIEKAGTAIENRALSKAEQKAEKERLAKMAPEDRAKVEELKRSEEENLKKAKGAADDAKGGAGKRALTFLKGAGGKLLSIVTLGAGAYYVWEHDGVGSAIESMAGSAGGEKPKPLSLDEQRERDRIVPGAEIPKASQTQQPVMPVPPNAERTATTMSQEVDALKTALRDVDYSRLMFPEAVGTSIDSGVIKLKNLTDSINVTTSAFKDLNNVNLSTLNDSINKLSSAMEKQSTAPKTDTKVSSVVPVGAEKELVTLLNQLNTSMGQMVSQQSDAVDYLSKTAKYTRQTSNNSA
jgi:hypothetical protein